MLRIEYCGTPEADCGSQDPGDLSLEEGVRVLVIEKTSDDWYVTLDSLFDDNSSDASTLQVDRRDRRAAGPNPCCICSVVVGDSEFVWFRWCLTWSDYSSSLIDTTNLAYSLVTCFVYVSIRASFMQLSM